MATAYPSAYPLPSISGLSAVVDAGIARTDTPTDQAQRRVYSTMPHVVSMTFVMTLSTYASWYDWTLNYGYRWFDISLPSMYAGIVGANLSTVTVRFISDVSKTMLAQDSVQVSVTAEFAPSMIADYLAVF